MAPLGLQRWGLRLPLCKSKVGPFENKGGGACRTIAVMDWSDNNNMSLHEDKFENVCHSATKTNYLCQLFLYVNSTSTKLL